MSFDASTLSGQVIDLTLTSTPSMRGIEIESAMTIEKEGWNASTYHLFSHSGTHMDAQIHFGAGDESIDQIPIERFIGPALKVLIDVNPSQIICVADIEPVLDAWKPGMNLIIQTNWSKHIENSTIYRDALPRIGVELANWCVENGVNMLGVEPPSVADVNNLEEVTEVHKILLEGKVVIVEGLTNLDQVPENKPFNFGAMPLKIIGGDGAPCRAFAII